MGDGGECMLLDASGGSPRGPSGSPAGAGCGVEEDTARVSFERQGKLELEDGEG